MKASLKKGALLLSEPHLADVNFSRSAVLLVEHGPSGSIGFVLNQPLKIFLADFMDELPMQSSVYQGGPCERNSLHFIHTLGSVVTDSIEIIPGLYWGGDIGSLIDAYRSGYAKEADLKFFIGYSGWDAQQLDAEIDMRSWVIASTTAHEIMYSQPSQIWRQSLKNMGHKFAIMSNAPLDPSWN